MSDDHNTSMLKHAFRWGVKHGAIDPASEKAKALWKLISGDGHTHRVVKQT